MKITKLLMQNFRSYIMEKFEFQDLTFIVGDNAAGKSNLLESINLLSTGKSYHAERDIDVINFDKDFARVKGKVNGVDDSVILEVLMKKEQTGRVSKKFLVNDVGRSRVNFSSNFQSLLFVPSDLDIINGSPGTRRRYLDSALYATNLSYRSSSIAYEKALRQRNALLKKIRDTGIRKQEEFDYWNGLIIKNGNVITESREEFIKFIRESSKDVINFEIEYDKSLINEERLDKYKSAEEALGVTLVGPHRDDLKVYLDKHRSTKSFGSRGQQRLVVLQMKLLELEYMNQRLGYRPVLLLDDIFSELDDAHIELVMEVIDKQQTIIATTHEEFIPGKLKSVARINL